MLPQHYVALDALPLLPNGKIDRHALPAPRAESRPPRARRRAVHAGGSAPWPRSGARCWAWSATTIARSDNFFDLGGDSLQVSRVVIAFQRPSGVRLEARRMIFESLAQLARGIELPEDEAAPIEEPANQPKGWFKRLFQRA